MGFSFHKPGKNLTGTKGVSTLVVKLNDCIQNTTAVCNPRQKSVQISLRQN